MEDIYNNQDYLESNPDWHEMDAPYKASKIQQLISDADLNPKTIAEIGTGSGEILVQLANQYPDTQFHGYDISKDALSIAQEKATDQIKFSLMDLSEIPSSEHYDIALVIDVIEHVQDYFSFLENLLGLSDYTIFHIPLDISLRTLLREPMLIESKNRVGHIHNFTEDFVLDMLSDYGFDVVSKTYTPPIIHNPTFRQRIELGVNKFFSLFSKRFSSKIFGGYSIMVLTKNTPGTRKPV